MARSQPRAAILVENLYQEMEVWYPIFRLQEAGAKVTIVGPEQAKYTSKLGYPVQADLAAAEAWGGPVQRLRLDFGNQPNRTIRLRNIVLRAPTARERELAAARAAKRETDPGPQPARDSRHPSFAVVEHGIDGESHEHHVD